MKNRLKLIVALAPVIIHSFLPFGMFFAFMFGYEFSLFNYTAFAVANTLVSVVSVVAVFLKKESFSSKVFFCLFGLSIPICFVDWMCYLVKSNSIVAVACTLISIACAVVAKIKISRFKVSKILLSVSIPLVVFALAFVSFVFTLLAGFGVNTIVEEIPSPKGLYVAEVVDADQGALGGNTVVYVSENRGVDLGICEFTDIPERVYIGEWGEYDDMDIRWKNDECLIINSTEYVLNGNGIVVTFKDFVYEPLCEEFSIPDFHGNDNPVYAPGSEHLPDKFYVMLFGMDDYMHWVYKLNDEEHKDVLADIEKGNWTLMSKDVFYLSKEFDGFYGGGQILNKSLLEHKCYVCVYDPHQEKIITNHSDYFCDDDSVYHTNWVIFLYDTETFEYYCIYATI